MLLITNETMFIALDTDFIWFLYQFWIFSFTYEVTISLNYFNQTHTEREEKRTNFSSWLQSPTYVNCLWFSFLGQSSSWSLLFWMGMFYVRGSNHFVAVLDFGCDLSNTTLRFACIIITNIGRAPPINTSISHFSLSISVAVLNQMAISLLCYLDICICSEFWKR